jgi:hypothetical protein
MKCSKPGGVSVFGQFRLFGLPCDSSSRGSREVYSRSGHVSKSSFAAARNWQVARRDSSLAGRRLLRQREQLPFVGNALELVASAILECEP